MIDLLGGIVADAIENHPGKVILYFICFALLINAVIGEISKWIWGKQ